MSGPPASTPAVSPAVRRLAVAGFLLALAFLQLSPAFVRDVPDGEPWFLFGTDTVFHDAIVQVWAWQAFGDSGGELPLWMHELKGGLPTLGAALWTPFAPSLWLHAAVDFPLAQRLQFVWALWWGGLGAYWLGRVLGLRPWAALVTAVAFCLSGHVVTLIHAGHLQKVLAIAWVPWIAGGAVKALEDDDPAGAWRGGGIGGLALGMTFLSGHPQIAYLALHLVLARAAWVAVGRRCWRRPVGVVAGICAIGGMVGAAQLAPMLEMGALSNRAGGVPWEEAIATSYPIAETAEFLLPRFRGDSSQAGFNSYAGAWGERLVSDYAGAVVIVLAVVALAWGAKRREAVFWLAVAVVTLVVGWGGHTPLYRVLYTVWPGMSSFRSPATSYVLVALALPVAAGLGTQAIQRLASSGFPCARRLPVTTGLVVVSVAMLGLSYMEIGDAFAAQAIARTARVLHWATALVALAAALNRWRFAPAAMAGGIALLAAGDLAHANGAFLRAEPWTRYQAYLAPMPLDRVLLDEPPPRRAFEPGRELALRPILHGRDALLGYHPISFATFEDHLAATGFGSAEWLDHWGVNWTVTGERPQDHPEGWELVGALPPPTGGFLWRDRENPGAVRLGGVPVQAGWTDYRPNGATLQVSAPAGGALLWAANPAPGWQVRVDGAPWRAVPPSADAAPARRVDLSPSASAIVEFQYRPASLRAGLLATGLGLMLVLGAATAGRRRPLTES